MNTNALTIDRLSREYGHAWLVLPEQDSRGYVASRLHKRGDDNDVIRERTLRALRDRLDVLMP